MASTLSSDVTVVGGGPAGTLCALHLLAQGLEVRIVDADRPRRQPPEILAPATLRALRGAAVETQHVEGVGHTCRGVASRWDGVGYFDYGLYACERALAVDRRKFDLALREAARRRGATVCSPCQVVRVERLMTGEYAIGASLGGREVAWHTRFVVDATGKSAARFRGAMSARVQIDRLVALAIPVTPARQVHDLLLEAASSGWWYAAAGDGGTAHVVFLTDADLLPRGRIARLDWLRRQYARSELVRSEIGGEPTFECYAGCDARRSFMSSPCGEGWLAVGDAAWSNDPLSGSGIQLAAEGAAEAALAISRYLSGKGSSFLATYAQWCSRTHRQTLDKHRAVYRSVHPSLRDEPFWRRRIVPTGNPASVIGRAA